MFSILTILTILTIFLIIIVNMSVVVLSVAVMPLFF